METPTNIKTSEATDKLFPALVAAWAEIETAVKDANNPFFNSVYADLPAVMGAIRPHFVKNSLAMLQPVSRLENQVLISTVILHSSGQWLSSDFAISATDSKPQSIGSAITYARRYAASAITGVVSDKDDDGNAASGSQAPNKPTQAAKPQAKSAVETKPTPKAATPPAEVHLATTLRLKIFDTLKGTEAENDSSLKQFYAGAFGKPFPQDRDTYIKPLTDLLRLLQNTQMLAKFKQNPEAFGTDWKTTNGNTAGAQ